jgi:adenosyl cobinamide kinase/adenosyl cobinamide phosphate guanylyltransferase
MYTFVTGGYRSGRSNYAMRRASEQGNPPWLYVGAGTETDDAIRKRIQHHRRDSEAIWRTAVMPANLLDLVEAPALASVGGAVFDGVNAWVEQRAQAVDADRVILDEVGELAERMYRSRVPIVVVSIEMGLGPWPSDPEDERLLRLVSSANQILAQQAAAVVLMVSGVPLKVR